MEYLKFEKAVLFCLPSINMIVVLMFVLINAKHQKKLSFTAFNTISERRSLHVYSAKMNWFRKILVSSFISYVFGIFRPIIAVRHLQYTLFTVNSRVMKIWYIGTPYRCSRERARGGFL